MSHWRRVFTAPGNPRIWISLVLYTSALVLLVVYRDRIGKAVSEGFRAVTGPPPPTPAKPPPSNDEAAEAVARAKALPLQQRLERLLALARAGNAAALEALEEIVLARPGRLSPAAEVLRTARRTLEDDDRALRAVAARLLLWAENVRPTKATAQKLASELASKRPAVRRREALRRLGLLGLAGARSKTAEARLARSLRDPLPAIRAAAARAAGRIGDPSYCDVLLRLVSPKQPAEVRDAALAGLTDLGLVGGVVRSEVMRSLAARLADREIAGDVAEGLWRTLRRLARSARAARMATGEAGRDGGPPKGR